MTAEHPDYYHLPNGRHLLDYIGHLDFITGNIIKYVYRHRAKNGAEDLRKALVYLDRLDPEAIAWQNTAQGSPYGRAVADLLDALGLARHPAAVTLAPLMGVYNSVSPANIADRIAELKANITKETQEASHAEQP